MPVPVRDASYNQRVLQELYKLYDKGLVVVPWGKDKKGETGWNAYSKEDGYQRAKIAVQIGNNYAIRADNIVIVDVDAKEKNIDKATEDMYTFATKVRMIDTFQQTSQSGNPHAFFLKDERMKLWKKTNGISGFIDVMTGNSGAVLASGSTTDTGVYSIYKDMELQRMPDWLFEKLNPVMNKEQTEEQKIEREQKKLEYEQTKDVGETEMTIRNCLEYLSPNCDYDTWIKIGMIIKTELGENGINVWDEWSSKGDSYDSFIMDNKWNSFKDDGALTIGTLITWARKAGMSPPSPTTPLKYHFVEDDDDIDFLKDKTDTKINELYKIKGDRPYNDIKEDFEKIVVKINSPFCYIRKVGNTITFINETSLKGIYQDLFTINTIVIEKDNNITRKEIKQLFLKRWLKDPSKKCYETMVFDPSRQQHILEYNTFVGYKAEEYPAIEKEKVLELVQPIIDHFDGVYGQENTPFVMKWLACPIQRPIQKSCVGIIVKGKQGTGKDIVMEAFKKNIIGEHYAFQTSSPMEDLFGKFSIGVQQKVFVIVDEVSGKDFMGNNDKLKNLITADTVRFEEKNVMCTVLPNLANFYFTTNNSNPIVIPYDDRRFVAFNCKDTYLGNETYFTNLANYLERTDVCRAFYQYLKDEIDLKGYDNFQAKRPKTDYYEELQRLNLNSIDRFLSFYVLCGGNADEFNGYIEPDTDVKAQHFYTAFLNWTQRRNFNCKTTNTSFGRHMKEFQGNGIEKKKTKEHAMYTIDIVKLMEYMQQMKRFDCDIF